MIETLPLPTDDPYVNAQPLQDGKVRTACRLYSTLVTRGAHPDPSPQPVLALMTAVQELADLYPLSPSALAHLTPEAPPGRTPAALTSQQGWIINLAGLYHQFYELNVGSVYFSLTELTGVRLSDDNWRTFAEAVLCLHRLDASTLEDPDQRHRIGPVLAAAWYLSRQYPLVVTHQPAPWDDGDQAEQKLTGFEAWLHVIQSAARQHMTH